MSPPCFMVAFALFKIFRIDLVVVVNSYFELENSSN